MGCRKTFFIRDYKHRTSLQAASGFAHCGLKAMMIWHSFPYRSPCTHRTIGPYHSKSIRDNIVYCTFGHAKPWVYTLQRLQPEFTAGRLSFTHWSKWPVVVKLWLWAFIRSGTECSSENREPRKQKRLCNIFNGPRPETERLWMRLRTFS